MPTLLAQTPFFVADLFVRVRTYRRTRRTARKGRPAEWVWPDWPRRADPAAEFYTHTGNVLYSATFAKGAVVLGKHDRFDRRRKKPRRPRRQSLPFWLPLGMMLGFAGGAWVMMEIGEPVQRPATGTTVQATFPICGQVLAPQLRHRRRHDPLSRREHPAGGHQRAGNP